MSVSYNTSIETNGLISYLDAANSKSYPGSGTTWTDLSGTGNGGVLTNGPTFSSSNKGIFTFDGSNDYVSLPNNLLIHNSGNPFTISIWFRTSTSGVILGQQNTVTPASASGYVPAIYVNSSGNLTTSCFWGGSTTNVSTSTFAVNNNTWSNITVTVQSTTHTSYFNGESYATLSKTQTTYTSTYYYYLGTGAVSGWPSQGASYFNGSIPVFMCYNRALSAAEVRKNFSALRGRYGV